MIAIAITPTTITSHKQAVQVVSRRATTAGIQYSVVDSLGTHIVTVNNGCIGCSCGLDRLFLECSHKRVVAARELAYAEEAARRAAYTELFGIY